MKTEIFFIRNAKFLLKPKLNHNVTKIFQPLVVHRFYCLEIYTRHRRVTRHIGPVSPNMQYRADMAGNAAAAKFYTLYFLFTSGSLCRGDVYDDIFMTLRVHARVDIGSQEVRYGFT